jgi:hypothetical protein
LIREILLALKVELEAGCPSGRLYGETMGKALAVHLVKTDTTLSSKPFYFEEGLPRHNLTQVLEYIQAHLVASQPIDSWLSVCRCAWALLCGDRHYEFSIF